MTVTENLYFSFCVDSMLIFDVDLKVVWLAERLLKVKVAIGDGCVNSPKHWEFELKGRTSSVIENYVENPAIYELLGGDEVAEKLNLPSEAEILLEEEIELQNDVLSAQLHIRQSRREFDLKLVTEEQSYASMTMAIINCDDSKQDLVITLSGTEWMQTHSTPTIASGET